MSRIIDYPELEETLKDHGSPIPGPAQGIPPNNSTNNKF